MQRKYLPNTVCALCRDVEQQQFVWSDMLHQHICWLCALELCIDFYPCPDKPGNYFQRVSELLSYDEWICRRLYLQEVLMHRSADSDVDVELCKQQMQAINDYLAAVNASRRSDDLHGAYIILLHKLKDRAFRCYLEGFGMVER